jgi:hypothetical protein
VNRQRRSFAFLRSTRRSGVVWLGIAATAVIGALLLSPPSNTDSRVAALRPAGGPLVAAKFLAPVRTHEDSVLGFKIVLPQGYRRSVVTMGDGQEAFIGRVVYTTASAAEERAQCEQDLGDSVSQGAAAYFIVEVYRNPSASSAAEWARNSPMKSVRATISPAAIGGPEAARFIEDGTAVAYAIRANGRIYLLAPAQRPSADPIDAIAGSFVPLAPSAVPSRSQSISGIGGASQFARELATAFRSRSAESVALLMPSCHFAISHTLNGRLQGPVYNRSVPGFIADLRAQLSGGTLTVNVDAQVQVETQHGRPVFFARSSWVTPTETRAIDLVLDAVDGRWQWINARHHLAMTHISSTGCTQFGAPWIRPGATC